MSQNAAGAKPWFRFALVFTFLVALVGLLAPQRRMPIDFRLMFWLSLPLAGIWLATFDSFDFSFSQRKLFGYCWEHHSPSTGPCG